MADSSDGAFKNFRVIWFPFSVNAMAIGTLAWLLFWAFSYLLAVVFGGGATHDGVLRSFTANFMSLVLTGRAPLGNAWLFAVQLAFAFVLWAIPGVAICRILALRIGRDEYCPVKTALGYAWKNRATALLYPAAVAAPVVFLVVCNALAGAVGHIPWIGWLLAIPLYPLALIASTFIFVILIAGVLGIGMVAAAIAVERKGTFDCIGKAFNYIFARPIPFLIYFGVTAFLLSLIHHYLLEAELLQTWAARTMTAIPLGGPFRSIVSGDPTLTGAKGIFAWIFGFMNSAVGFLVMGLILSHAMAASTSMFMIFRKDVDGIEPGDVYRDEITEPAPPAAPPAPQGGTPAPSGGSQIPVIQTPVPPPAPPSA